jgi:hypothetical protein
VSALLLTMVVLAGAPDAGVDAPRVPDVLAAMKSFRKSGHDDGTPCASCHGTASWSDVRFNHERTGFSLTGKHARTSCKACHVTDFTTPLPRTCLGCHRDVHAGELGARCESCHDTADWRSRFDADAHRRTNFPLFGAHAALPCTECHAEARERRFSRAAVDCQSCHGETAAVRTLGQAVDHEKLGFVTRSCRECHNGVQWKPALFPSHDVCLPISAGPHAGVACASCHADTTAPVAHCRTNTATLCINCHVNTGGGGVVTETNAIHAEKMVPGYSYSGAKCAQCHSDSSMGGP